MRKEKYEVAKMDVVLFDVEDIIVTSEGYDNETPGASSGSLFD